MLKRTLEQRTQVGKLLDAGLFGLALWVAHLIRSQIPMGGIAEVSGVPPFSGYFWLYAFLLPLTPLIFETQGFYVLSSGVSFLRRAWIALKASAILTVVLMAVVFIFQQQSNIGRLVLVGFGGLGFGLVMSKELLLHFWGKGRFGRSVVRHRYLLIGSLEDTGRLRKDFDSHLGRDVERVIEMDVNSATPTGIIHMLHEHSINGVVLCATHAYFSQVEEVIQVCELEGVETWLIADFFKTQVSRTSVDDLFGRPVLVFRSTPDSNWEMVAKHVVDFLGAAFLLCLMSLPLLVVAMLVRLTSPGPVFFRQQRSGLNGRPFTMYKFRSMVTNAEQLKHELAAMNEMSGPVFKVTNDPRVTPVGRFMRKTSLDEFPQLFNVLKGEMSLVGPRPLPVDETRRFDDIAHRRRLSVKPGLTCLWQISGRNEVKNFDDWVRLDLEYIDNWTFWLDIKILCQTIPVVLLRKGAK